NSFCNLPAVVGRCKGYFPRYFYNTEAGKCQRFIYG
nr:RecName: Full=Kunitz-type proteinase inhibitor AEPI-III [Actinia equina]